MKIKFKKQQYQTAAVNAVIDCFKGQPYLKNVNYPIASGRETRQLDIPFQDSEELGFRNGSILLSEDELLDNIQSVQKRQNIPVSTALVKTNSSSINLDIEMETGTGKTYCYIKTIFEMNKRFGWSKFIVVVPSVAIREGVHKSFSITAEHFQADYGKKPRCFIYNSSRLDKLERFSSDSGINVMIINIQAFNSSGKDHLRIYEELDDFQTRRPMDVIRANRPILILDEPQKMEGKNTLSSLKKFNPLFILRYSATHKTQHNKVHRLDALDAYNQKLVKKISVCGISAKALPGTNAYLYVDSIHVSNKPPVARIELEIRQKNGIKRAFRTLKKGDSLYDISGKLNQYKGFVISNIDAVTDTVHFINGNTLETGEAAGDVDEIFLRRLQIREAIKAHLKKEQQLFSKGIKVLTLFFIDEVAKYRVYTEKGQEGGVYATIFEEEYSNILAEFQPELLNHERYLRYLDSIPADETHNGYFSIDKKGKMIDSIGKSKKERQESTDQGAYALILKNKERLLSFDEPTRFIFSHSALREGWDNPNVFVICTLKHSSNMVSRRQEVGRGLRISVNQAGERQDNPTNVHHINVLTVVASESYTDFVTGLQKDISESLSERPRVADIEYFTGKILQTDDGAVEMTVKMAKTLYKYLIKNDYIDDDDNISSEYLEAVNNAAAASLPQELQPYQAEIFLLIDSVYSEARLPELSNERNVKRNALNENFESDVFQNLWDIMKQKAVYTVDFDSNQLIEECIQALNSELKIAPLRYLIQRGEQKEDVTYDQLMAGDGFTVYETAMEKNAHSVHSTVAYDLVGKITEETQLTRRTISMILSGIHTTVFESFIQNPEGFIAEVIRLILEQKAKVVVANLQYEMADIFASDIFVDGQERVDFRESREPLKRHIYDYVMTDSKVEQDFVQKLDTCTDVAVYAKLPKGFSIPTPVGNYSPDWAIAFTEGATKQRYVIAETKGSMSNMTLREIERIKIACAQKFFQKINRQRGAEDLTYGVVDSFEHLLTLVEREDE